MSRIEELQNAHSQLEGLSRSFGDLFIHYLGKNPQPHQKQIFGMYESILLTEEVAALYDVSQEWGMLDFLNTLSYKALLAAQKAAEVAPDQYWYLDELEKLEAKHRALWVKHQSENKRLNLPQAKDPNAAEALPLREQFVEISFGDVFVRELDGAKKVITGVPDTCDAGTFLSGKITWDDRGREMIEPPNLEDTNGMIIVDRWEAFRVLGAFERGWMHYCAGEPEKSFVKMYNSILNESARPSQKLPVVVKQSNCGLDKT